MKPHQLRCELFHSIYLRHLCLPLSGCIQDLNPLKFAYAGRIKKATHLCELLFCRLEHPDHKTNRRYPCYNRVDHISCFIGDKNG